MTIRSTTVPVVLPVEVGRPRTREPRTFLPLIRLRWCLPLPLEATSRALRAVIAMECVSTLEPARWTRASRVALERPRERFRVSLVIWIQSILIVFRSYWPFVGLIRATAPTRLPVSLAHFRVSGPIRALGALRSTTFSCRATRRPVR